jgi:exonuclease 3'-5' domain-containing protein 1
VLHPTLKFILESKTIPKVFFDVRNDSDALFAHYAISLHCITDLQLMELATTRRPSRDYLTGLSKCIDYDSGISLSERLRAQRIKSQGTRLYAPEQGGFYNVFIKRPLKDDIREYCVHDVLHMPALWRAYNARIGAFWREMVREGSEKRVHESWGKEYVPQGEHKKFGCWSRGMIARARKRWDTGARSGLMDT